MWQFIWCGTLQMYALYCKIFSTCHFVFFNIVYFIAWWNQLYGRCIPVFYLDIAVQSKSWAYFLKSQKAATVPIQKHSEKSESGEPCEEPVRIKLKPVVIKKEMFGYKDNL